MEESRSPLPLKKGDLIYITAPAKAIEKDHVLYAQKMFEDRGFKVRLSEHCLSDFHYFSGTDAQRAQDLQKGIDDPEVKAIVCARGGYGCIRIIDMVQWAGIIREPKWIVGFSDVTVFHQRLQRYGVESIHGSMPLNFKENTPEAIESLFKVLEGRPHTIEIKPHLKNIPGSVKGKLIGGNLSILYSLLSTDEKPDYSNSILFIEDLAEQLYHIDRIFHTLRKSGVLGQIKGLIVGGMTDMRDTFTPFGKTLEEIIVEQFQFHKIPICFNFPAGHINDNRALILGRNCSLEVNTDNCYLHFE